MKSDSLATSIAAGSVGLLPSGSDDTATARARFLDSLRETRRRTGERLSREVDSLDRKLENMLQDTLRGLKAYSDSVAAGARPLRASEEDSIRSVRDRFESAARTLRSDNALRLQDLLSRFMSDLERMQLTRAECQDCARAEDFQMRLSLFIEDAGSIAEVFRDTVAEVRDEFRYALEDTFDTYRSTLLDVRHWSTGEGAGSVSEPRGSAFVAGIRYTSHFAYRGRDDGSPTYAVIPSVSYQHASGISVSLTRYWFAHAYIPWSEIDLGAEYDFDVTDDVSTYLGYTHFWFSDSSELSRSIFTNSAYGGVSWSTPLPSFELDMNEDFGTQSAFTTIASVSFPFTIKESGSGWGLSSQPAIAAVYGQQIFRLVPQLLIDSTGIDTTGVVRQNSKFFGVMDYELVVPFTLTLGSATLLFSLLYDIPVNVPDQSASRPFFSAAATLNYAFR